MTNVCREKLKIAISTEYLGVDFHGWQRQENAHTVQAELEDAWFELTSERIVLNGSSRTDAGVSARRHISSFVTCSSIPVERIPLAWNTKLGPGVAVREAKITQTDFDPRFDALGKEYTYSFYLSKTRPVIERFQTHHVPQKLDLAAMREASASFLGEHDFTALMDQGSPSKRPCRSLYSLVLEEADPFLHLHVIGDGFLYHMVRILAGTLLYVGLGKLTAQDIPLLLKERDRRAMGPTLSACGLTLERVFYKDELFGSDRWPYHDWQAES
ncbi:MAG: tRNA pseudouridine(38-40) synthase TruA [Eubacteriales bacterium]|nr:tRNA pseudouridine(38-40) synthase TruA [Eubacteriales bacterium]MDD4324513.1 tRNA pseudouridine(38-40) synthase TruA [Eubacteriales bacterium]MDD4540799.1 tRNA pseudouridine(38-40) synthase TruA [Eubacteriales bacterium]